MRAVYKDILSHPHVHQKLPRGDIDLIKYMQSGDMIVRQKDRVDCRAFWDYLYLARPLPDRLAFNQNGYRKASFSGSDED